MKQKQQCLTIEQAQIFAKAISGHDLESLLTFALVTGMRRGELLALRWSDLDEITRSVHIHQMLSYVQGTFAASKCERTLVLPSSLLSLLVSRRLDQSDLVFCKSQGQVWSPSGLHRALNDLLSSAQLPPMRFLDLRYSTMSLLISLGVSIQVIEALLGLSPQSSTVQRLSPVPTARLSEAIEKLYRFLW